MSKRFLNGLAGLAGLAFALVAASCVTSPARPPEEPRRVYQSVSTEGMSLGDMFIVDPAYAKVEAKASDASIAVSSLLFAKDLDLLERVGADEIKRIGELFFSDFPVEGAIKEIVIPALSTYEPKGDEKSAIERDAYFFIIPTRNKDGRLAYRVETNIPISSLYASYYDGYVVSPSSNFYKDKVPARWTAVMGIAVDNGIVAYQGMSYPARVAPLYFSGTGIAPDARLANLVAHGADLRSHGAGLEKIVGEAVAKTEVTSEAQKASLDLLRKYSFASLAFYALVDGDAKAAGDYLSQAKAIDVAIHDDVRGAQCVGLIEFVERAAR